jgi:conjugative relaxase-like TrwC/TraI family protein
MLSIKFITDAEYYLDQSSAEYYLIGGEPPGKWYGQGATALGLNGIVAPDALRAMFRGMNEKGDLLVQLQEGKKHQPAWDLTFSAPKPFSIVWSAARPPLRRALERIQRRAVRQALEYLQEVAGLTRRGKGGQILERADLVFALFDHSTSRELDPQIHTHALLMNVAGRVDGTTGTIVSKTIYDHKLAAGAVYQSALAQGLFKLGFTIFGDKVGFDIDGISPDLSREQSKRRKAIEAALGSNGLSSAKASAVAALTTRQPKQAPPRQELFEAWTKTNEAHGVTSKWIDNIRSKKDHFYWRQMEVLAGDLIADGNSSAQDIVVKLAVVKVSTEQSHFSARDIYRTALRKSVTYGFDVDTLYRVVQEHLEAHCVALGRRDGYIRYATHETLKIEQELLANIDKLTTNDSHRVDRGLVDEVIERRLPLGPGLTLTELTRNMEQRLGVQQITGNSGGVQNLVGMAGTGKTFALGVAREIWEEAGAVVLGLCQAGAAARRLEEGSGIKSDTLALFLTKIDHATLVTAWPGGGKHYIARPTHSHPEGEVLIDGDTVLVVDEVTQVNTEDYAKLVSICEECAAKLVNVGDRRQQQSVQAGGFMKSVEERAGKAELRVITRQNEELHDPVPLWQRQVVEHFANGNSVDALLLLAERGKISVLDDRDQARLALIKDWSVQSAHRPESHLLLAGTNAEVAELNRGAQDVRRQKGLLGEQSVIIGEETIHVGDRVLCTERSRALRIENGDFGEAVRIDARRRVITIKLDSGTEHELPIADYPHLSLGYATTVFRSQGASVEKTSVIVGGATENLHQANVEASRHKAECRLYASRFETGQLLENLAIQMGQSREKDLAIDVLRESKGKPFSYAYYELQEQSPAAHRLDLEKLDRLQTLLLTDGKQINPPQKTEQEIKDLLQRLRESRRPREIAPPTELDKSVELDAPKLSISLRSTER